MSEWRPISEAPKERVLIVATRATKGGQNFWWPPKVRIASLMEPGPPWRDFLTGGDVDFDPEFYMALPDLPAGVGSFHTGKPSPWRRLAAWLTAPRGHD